MREIVQERHVRWRLRIAEDIKRRFEAIGYQKGAKLLSPRLQQVQTQIEEVRDSYFRAFQALHGPAIERYWRREQAPESERIRHVIRGNAVSTEMIESWTRLSQWPGFRLLAQRCQQEWHRYLTVAGPIMPMTSYCLRQAQVLGTLKASSIFDFRNFLDRGYDPVVLRQYVDSLRQGPESAISIRQSLGPDRISLWLVL